MYQGSSSVEWGSIIAGRLRRTARKDGDGLGERAILVVDGDLDAARRALEAAGVAVRLMSPFVADGPLGPTTLLEALAARDAELDVLRAQCALQAAGLAGLDGISEAVVGDADVEEALERGLTACMKVGGFDVGALYLMGDGGDFSCRTGHLDSEAQAAAYADFFGQPALLRALMATDEATLLPSTLVPAEAARPFLARSGLRAAVVVPLLLRGETLGALMLGSTLVDSTPLWLTLGRSLVNQVAQAVAVARALGDRARSERGAREQAGVLRSILDSMGEGVVVADAHGRVVLHNAAAASILGLRPGEPLELARLTIRDASGALVARDDMPVARAIRGESVERANVVLEHDLGPRHLSVSTRPLKGVGGAIRGGVSVFRDATAEVHAQQALDRARQDFREVIERAPDAILVLRGDRIVYANSAFKRLLGHGEDEQVAGVFMADLVDGERDDAALPLRCADGRLVRVEISPARTISYEGRPAELRVARDVTERLELQSQLMLTDRMAALGLLAAGVAHEINNPLAAVTANIQYVHALLTEGEGAGQGAADEIIESLADAIEAADRVREIVLDLKLFSRSGDEASGPVDIHQVIEGALRMARNEIRHRARLERDYDVRVPAVEGNEARLGQVVLNLVVNAAQAMPVGNALDHTIRVSTRLGSPGMVVIEVRDDGPGMPPEVAQNIFTPFFTTKPVGEGTGLGLSICHRIITRQGGSIRLDTAPGRGTTFRVELPSSAERVVPATPTPSPKARAWGGRVLVVDDEPTIGAAVRRICEPDHEVVLHTDPRAALDVLRRGADFDVILCDLMMPEMTGMDFHEALTEARPDCPERVVFLTGGAFTPSAQRWLDRTTNPTLMKPFDAAALRSLIDDQVNARPTAKRDEPAA